MTAKSAERVGGFDLLRIIAAVAVVGIHVLAAGWPYRGAAGNAQLWVYTSYTFIWFATPAFAFLTGALVWNYRPIKSVREYGSFLRRRSGVVVYPFLFWSAFYIWYARYTPIELRPTGPPLHYIVDVARLLVMGRASFHLYFLPIVVMFYLVAPLFSLGFARRPVLTFLGLWAVGTFGSLVVTGFGSEHLVSVYRVFQLTMWLLPAAAAGGLYGAMRQRWGTALALIWPVLLGAGLLLRWLDRGPVQLPNPYAQSAFSTTYLVLTLIGLVCLMELVARKLPALARASQWLGAGAFGVYLVHPVGIAWVTDWLISAHLTRLWGRGWFAVLATAVVLVGSYAFCYLVMLSPYTSWIIGVKGGRRPRRAVPAPANDPEEAL